MNQFFLILFSIAKQFLTNLFNAFKSEKLAYQNVLTKSISADNSFINQNPATSTYTTSIQSMNELINQSGTAYAKFFGDAGSAYELLEQQIMSSQ